VRLERPPLTGFKYSGGAVMIQQLALMDAVGRPFADIARDWVLTPIGMTNSTYEQPLPAGRQKQAAPRTTARREDGRALARLSRAGRGRLVDHADRSREVPDRSAGDAGRPIDSRADASSMLEMVTPCRRRTVCGGIQIGKQGEGWYFMHGGSNWAIQCNMIAHRIKGYGLVIMTNGDNGGALMQELGRRIQQAYSGTYFDQPIPRTYGRSSNGHEQQNGRDLTRQVVFRRPSRRDS
jgi:CubicO group peptidase (beta-lactamase class C family)